MWKVFIVNQTLRNILKEPEGLFFFIKSAKDYIKSLAREKNPGKMVFSSNWTDYRWSTFTRTVTQYFIRKIIIIKVLLIIIIIIVCWSI